MVWAISTDDTKWTATRALTGHTGFKAEASFLGGKSTLQNEPITSCQWGACGKEITCPAGMSPAQSGNGKKNGLAGIYSGCKSGEKRGYCCPSDGVPQCTWRGTAPACNGKCQDTEINVSSNTHGGGAVCLTGHKVLCCSHVQGDSQIGQCKWEGASPYCSSIPGTQYGCNEKDRKSLTYSSYGPVERSAVWRGTKVFAVPNLPLSRDAHGPAASLLDALAASRSWLLMEICAQSLVRRGIFAVTKLGATTKILMPSHLTSVLLPRTRTYSVVNMTTMETLQT